MSESEQDIEVSFADVAAESPDDSVAREAGAVDDGVGTDEESRNDSPPEQPTIASLTAGGPVDDGAEPAI